MKTKDVESGDVKRINELVLKGYKLHMAYKDKREGKIKLLLIKE